ncbi:hypothetical protein GCM10017673_38620 [Streptosporangium violaceochromogenes]|nr:hypothetical protein GCM10017673_38620 [Streptosporangium violaceochromogenes]
MTILRLLPALPNWVAVWENAGEPAVRRTLIAWAHILESEGPPRLTGLVVPRPDDQAGPDPVPADRFGPVSCYLPRTTPTTAELHAMRATCEERAREIRQNLADAGEHVERVRRNAIRTLLNRVGGRA